MSGLGEFFHMGGYAAYVWPAYGVAAAVLAGLLAESVLRLRRARRRLAALEAADGGADDAA
ncbi:MAG: heme exporter protein CcmD [Alphaproteobacteria bacterium]|nr:heme exporter protein CcmD [Alphaproteobacteria bacterium]MCY3754529.1 heme exporter protein CcmD [Alphaproteobacteria bacterium]MYE59579.1 heme exporter protein CcmD [Alphaproteobacteria bacterium]